MPTTPALVQPTSPRDTLTDPERALGLVPSDSDLIESVMLASRALVGLAARSLCGLGEDVTLPQFRVLVVLSTRGPMGLGTLAETLGVSPSSATRACDRLARKQLVRRARQARDRRQVRITLTPAGTRLVENVFERRRAETARILATMTPRAKAHLVEALSAFAAAAGEPALAPHATEGDADLLSWAG